MSNSEYLIGIRKFELEQIVSLMRPGAAVLEIGAGAGWQARTLAEHGCRVLAIDISGSLYEGERVWDVFEYDGFRIPFNEGEFDIVFSSNVLEHIAHVESFQAEIQRVLRPDGMAIHVLPSSTWRFWSSLTYYPFILKEIWYKVFQKATIKQLPPSVGTSKDGRFWKKFFRLLLAPRHGEAGNAITEIFYFSRIRWIRLFKRSGWSKIACFQNGLFYTGHLVFGPRITLRVRKKLAFFLGSACWVFVLRKAFIG